MISNRNENVYVKLVFCGWYPDDLLVVKFKHIAGLVVFKPYVSNSLICTLSSRIVLLNHQNSVVHLVENFY
jgi:hypothetical protein